MTEENQEVIEDVIADDMDTLAAEVAAEYAGTPTDEEEEEVEEVAEVEAEVEEVIEAVTQEEDTRSKSIPRDRFDKVNDGKKAAEAELEAMRAELAEYKSVLREKLDAKEEVVDDYDPLDPEADAKHTKEMDELRQEINEKNFIAAVNSENTAFGTANPQEWKDKQDSVLADIAIGHLNDAADMGDNLTEKQAFDMAQAELAQKMYKLYESGKSMGAYIDTRAKSVAKKYAKPKEKEATRQKGVDVVELENLRNSAGASTNKTIGSRIKGGDSMKALMAEASAEVRKESF